MTITKTSRELTKLEKYMMTKDSAIEVIKDLPDGYVMNVTAWCEFEDVDAKTGEPSHLISYLLEDGSVYACQSRTFNESAMDIWDLFSDEESPVVSMVKVSGKSKAGRTYVDCTVNKEHYK